MSRAALPGSRGKEKDRPNARDRSSKWSREPKVDQVFENTDETTIQGGEFSADEENQEEELYKRIVSERNTARLSKNTDSQVKGKSGERVRERVRPTEERDENEDRNKPVKKTVSQQPQQQQVFTTAFQLQLGILIVVVVLSLLAHYFLFTHLYRNLRVSESQQNHFKRTDNNQNYDIDSKVDEAIKSKLNQTDIVYRVQNTLSVELDKFDISGNVKQKIQMELSDVDIDKKVKDSLKPEVLKIVEETKSTKVEIEQLLQSAKAELDQERVKFNARLETYQGRIVEAVEDATNIKTLIPNAKEMNKLHENINEMSIKYSKIMAKETDDLKIGKLQVSVEEGERELAVIREEFGELQKNIKNALVEYAKHKDRIKEIKEELDVIQPNTFNKESFMMAFMILTVMVCVLAVAVFNIYQRGSSTEPVHTNGPVSAKRNTKDMGSNDVLRRIPQSPNLQPGVCIISYDDARTGFHREVFDSANIPKCDVKSHVIRRHEQIEALPRCKVYLMCTEFSERHVIIEEPGLGLGDLHRTTYYAVKKLGGCLIILYTKDPGSKKLRNQANQALYNTDIYCVKKQQELSNLEQNNGFYSTYDKLSEHQKTVLRQKIVDNMT